MTNMFQLKIQFKCKFIIHVSFINLKDTVKPFLKGEGARY